MAEEQRLTRARLALESLKQEQAPANVIDAAEHALLCAQMGWPIPLDIRAVLVKHSNTRTTQNRWGK